MLKICSDFKIIQRELLLLTMTVSMCMLICAGMAYALEKVFIYCGIDEKF